MLEIHPILAFSDNYIWCIVNKNTRKCVLVDPGCYLASQKYLTANSLELTAILLTHKHHDHIGGVEQLLDNTKVPVYGPAHEDIANVSHPLQDGQSLHIGELNLQLQVMHLPGHTLGHIVYYNTTYLFAGDVLFAGGCGRLFEGTFAQMLNSLQRLKQLNKETLVFCAHEYTQTNLRFCATIESNNPNLQARVAKVNELRSNNLPSIPFSLEEDLATNVFLRTDNAQLQQLILPNLIDVNTKDLELAIFKYLRTLRNNFS